MSYNTAIKTERRFSVTAVTLILFLSVIFLITDTHICSAQSWTEEKPLNSQTPFYAESFRSLTKLNCQIPINSFQKNTPPQINLWKTLDTSSYSTAVSWSDDERYFAMGVGLGSYLIEVRDFPNLKLISRIKKKSPMGNESVLFLPKSDTFLISTVLPYDGDNSNSYSLISASSGKLLREITGYSVPPKYPLANSPGITQFSNDGKFLISMQNGAIGTIFLYDTKSWSIIGSLQQYGSITSGPYNSQISIIHSSKGALDKKLLDKKKLSFQELTVFDLHSRQSKLNYEIPAQYPFSAHLAAANWNSCILVLGSIDTTGLNSMYKEKGFYDGLLKTSNGLKIIIFGSQLIFDLEAVEPIERITISPKFKTIAYADGLNNVYALIITNSDHFFIRKISQFSTMVSDLAFSPDGKYLAIAGDKNIQIFSIGE